jgi:hypothetical protein
MPGQSGYAAGWGSLALINAGLAQAVPRPTVPSGRGRPALVRSAVPSDTGHAERAVAR